MSVWVEPFNGKNNGRSWENRRGYKIPKDSEGKNLLTGSSDVGFTAKEIEVWSISK